MKPKLRRVHWLPVAIIVLNLTAIIWVLVVRDYWQTALILLLSAICLTILEGVRVVESRRARVGNTTPNPAGRGR